MKLREAGEDRLLSRLLPSLGKNKNVVVGARDDCAVVKLPRGDELLLLKTDCVVEKIHFESSAAPARVGWKAIMRPLSDFAAMSGLPQFALVTLIVPSARSTSWVSQLYHGLNRAARKFGVAIVGGETSNTRGHTAISVSVAGYVEKNRVVLRSGGRVRDDLFVTGKLGGSIRGHHLNFVPRINESRWLTKNFRVHAMIDLSDGLGADLPRLARASKVGYKIDIDSLPLSPGAKIDNALNDGEDFELLFAVSSRDRKRLQTAWRKKFPRLSLTRIGSFIHPSSFIPHPFFRGYVHFK